MLDTQLPWLYVLLFPTACSVPRSTFFLLLVHRWQGYKYLTLLLTITLSSEDKQSFQLYSSHSCPPLSATWTRDFPVASSCVHCMCFHLLEDAVINSITVEASSSCALDDARGLAGVAWRALKDTSMFFHIHSIRRAKRLWHMAGGEGLASASGIHG